MEPVSIIIMLLGMAVLVALYFMSRASRKIVPKEQDMHIHAIRDDEGRLASSVKDDMPGDDMSIEEAKEVQESVIQKAVQETQLVLFIASLDDESGINGNKLLNVMDRIGLKYGEMDLFHRLALTDKGEVSIYTIANGIEPWTLKPDDIRGSNTPGVSLILNLPSLIDDVQAIEDFVNVATVLSKELNAVLKNQQQERFGDADKQAMLALVQ
jgi:cell division protein ZipA